MASFDRIEVKNIADVARLQDNIAAAITRLGTRPLESVSLVENVALGIGTVAVRHGLTGPVRGWIVVKANAGVAVYSPVEHSNPAEFIYMQAAASITVSLLFF
ncbi:MAG: hypothetical protein M3R04_03235 [bacterium]|nr:hypothetical protein [bacterium]